MLLTLAAVKIGPYVPILVFTGFVVLVVLGIILGNRADKNRRLAIAGRLSGHGWTTIPEPAEPDKHAAFTRFAHIGRLPDGPKGVRWAAEGMLDGHPAAIIEYTYSTGSGKSRQTHNLTLVGVAAPNQWPLFTLFPESFFHRIGEKLGLKADLKLENETFNKRWRISGQSDDTALAILSPEIQQLLEKADNTEWWAIGRGRIVVCHTRKYAPDKLATVTGRMEEFLLQLDPALRESLPRGRDVPPPLPSESA